MRPIARAHVLIRSSSELAPARRPRTLRFPPVGDAARAAEQRLHVLTDYEAKTWCASAVEEVQLLQVSHKQTVALSRNVRGNAPKNAHGKASDALATRHCRSNLNQREVETGMEKRDRVVPGFQLPAPVQTRPPSTNAHLFSAEKRRLVAPAAPRRRRSTACTSCSLHDASMSSRRGAAAASATLLAHLLAPWPIAYRAPPPMAYRDSSTAMEQKVEPGASISSHGSNAMAPGVRVTIVDPDFLPAWTPNHAEPAHEAQPKKRPHGRRPAPPAVRHEEAREKLPAGTVDATSSASSTQGASDDDAARPTLYGAARSRIAVGKTGLAGGALVETRANSTGEISHTLVTPSFDLQVRVLVRLLVAVVVGGIIGVERRSANSLAGVRTFSLVSLGAAIFMSTALIGFPQGDPVRFGAAISTSVGFLGAGAMHQGRTYRKGMTTAAGIWLAAALGIAAAAGMFLVAFTGSIATVLISRYLRFDSSLHLIRNDYESTPDPPIAARVVEHEEQPHGSRTMLRHSAVVSDNAADESKSESRRKVSKDADGAGKE